MTGEEKNMAKLLRKFSFVLAFSMLIGQFNTASVYAVETGAKLAQEPVELTSIEIVNLDEPVPGKKLDTSATVTSAEGAGWDIPVIWIDESGKTATVAEPGKRYVPTFAMYVPNRYKIRGMDASGKFPVRLPAFLTALYGTDSVVFLFDPSSQIIYIFSGPGLAAGGLSSAPSTADTGNTGRSEADGSSSTDDKSEAGEQSVVEKYCAPSAIEHFRYNDGFLEWFVNLIINEIQPQAVKLLLDGFPAYAEAAQNGELSTNIGLYVYNDVGEIDILAFVTGDYFRKDEFGLILGVNTSSFVLVQDDNGKWVIDKETRYTFENTVVHEMMHGFMFDYTRYGMETACYDDHDKGFPFWFIEGTAGAVDNTYKYHHGSLEYMMTDSGFYTPDSVKEMYMLKNSQGRSYYDLSNAVSQGNGLEYQISVYCSGYLACAYLGYLDARSRGESVCLEGGGYDIDAIRGGINHILSRLHGTGDGSDCLSLDDVIKEISGSEFENTRDFEDKFIKNNRDSNVFVANYLQMLEDIPTSGDARYASGSLLLNNEKQNACSSIVSGYEPGDQAVYRISDQSGVAFSNVDDVRANTTGGTAVRGDGNHDYVIEENEEDNNEQLAAAARMEEAALTEVVPIVPAVPEEEVPARDEVPEEETPAIDAVPETEMPAIDEVPVMETPAVEITPEEETPAIDEVPETETPAPEITDETTDDPVDTEYTTDGSSDEAESEE